MFETLTKNPAMSYEARVRDRRRSKNGRHSINMNTQMGSSLPSEKLDRSNYSSWEYKMNRFLVRQGHWTRAPSRGTKPRRGAAQRRREESCATPRRSRKLHRCRRSRRKPNRTLDASHLSLRGRVEISSLTRSSYIINHVTTYLPR